MTFDHLLPAFAEELVKLGFKSMKKEPVAAKVDRHFTSTFPDWAAFERNLRSKPFRELAKGHEKADPKLKLYIKNFGGYLASKDEVAKLRSKDSGTTYVIKDLHTGRFGCNCGDWQYKKSVRGGDCKHIKSLKQSKMVKASAVSGDLLPKETRKAALMAAGILAGTAGGAYMAHSHWKDHKKRHGHEKKSSWDVMLTNPITTALTLNSAVGNAKKHWAKGKAISEIEKQVEEEDKAKREARAKAQIGVQ